MPDNGEQLNIISQQIDTVIQLLQMRAAETGEQTVQESVDQDTAAREMSATKDESKSMEDKPRQVVKEADPVKILGFSPKALDNLSASIGTSSAKEVSKVTDKTGGFVQGLIDSIGMPLLALAGGITALLASSNINFGAFEGVANMLGKYGLVGGLKMFVKPFAKLLGKNVLKRIPVVGALVSFYTAYERFRNKDYVRMGIDIVSGLLNLVPTGITQILSFGLDMFTAFLDTKYQGESGNDELKADALDLVKTFVDPLLAAIGGVNTLKYIPFIGTFFHASDAFNHFKSGDYGLGLASTAQAIALLFPVVGTAVSAGIGILKAIADPSQKKQDPIAGSVIDFASKIGDAFTSLISDWYNSLDDDGVTKWLLDKAMPDSWRAALGAKKSSKPRMDVWNDKSISKTLGADGATQTRAQEFESNQSNQHEERQMITTPSGGERPALTYKKIGGLSPSMLRRLKEATDKHGWTDQELKMIDNQLAHIEKINNTISEDSPISKINNTTSEDSPISKKASNTFAGGISVGGAFGGYRQSGGPVSSGQTYMVGEAGPEIFTPSESGNITSNDDITNLLKQNNDVLVKLADNIMTAIESTGNVVNNTSVASNAVNYSDSTASVKSFRDQVRDTMFK